MNFEIFFFVIFANRNFKNKVFFVEFIVSNE